MHRRDFIKTCTATAAALAGSTSYAGESVGSLKRGCCFSPRDPGWLDKVRSLRPGWLYSWGLDRPEGLPREVEFTPMMWGNMDDTRRRAALADVATRARAGKVKHLLAFNEPDQIKQSGMTVERVIDLWPELMEAGVPLVSPGCVHPDKEWMIRFMDEADRRGLRVDAVAVHSYGGPNADALVKRLEQVHHRFGKPLWITEFAVGDWQAKSLAENRFSPERVLGFLKEVLPALDGLAFVQRYAWFSSSKTPSVATSSLFDDRNQLTPLGEVYRQGPLLG